MPVDWITPATTAAGSILGMITQKQQDQRQVEQQKKLQELQMQGQKEMGTYNSDLQKNMWDYTSYENQKKHMEAAGLNPALMYGMGGGGGTTTGGISENVSGASAPAGSGREVQEGGAMGMQMAAQMKLIDSQVQVNESQANKNNVDAGKTAGVDTALGETNITKLIAETQNIKAKTLLTNAQAAGERLKNTITEATTPDQIMQIDLENKKAQQILFQLENNTEISDETKQTSINTIKQNYTNQVLEGALKKSNIQVNEQQIKTMANQIIQGWATWGNEQRKTAIAEIVGKSSSELMDKEKSLLTAQTVMQGIGQILGGAANAAKAGKALMQ